MKALPEGGSTVVLFKGLMFSPLTSPDVLEIHLLSGCYSTHMIQYLIPGLASPLLFSPFDMAFVYHSLLVNSK